MEAAFFETALAGALGSWPGGTVFLAAVSGGADSTAMLAGLAALREKGDFVLRSIHVNHGIRSPEENSGDKDAVIALCRRFKIPCRVVTVPQGRIAALAREKGIGVEAAARNYRHAAWNREAQRTGAAKVLVAHTRDDALENLLMAFIRGAGPGGLSLMPPARFRVLRPLIGLGREEVLRYLEARGLSYREDSTNADTRYFRNRVRRVLTPVLDREFPVWRSGLSNLGKTQALVSSHLKKESGRAVVWESRKGRLETSRSGFFAQDEIVREEAVYRGLKLLLESGPRTRESRAAAVDSPRAASPRRPRRRVVRQFAGGLVSAADLGGVRITNENTKVVMGFSRRGKGGSSLTRGFSFLVSLPGPYTLKNMAFTLEAAAGQSVPANLAPELSAGAAFFTALPLVFRGELPGDRFFSRGKLRPLKDLLPLKKREGDLVVAEDSEGIRACLGLAQGELKVLLYEKDTRIREGRTFLCRVHSGGVHAEQEE